MSTLIVIGIFGGGLLVMGIIALAVSKRSPEL
jgi:hypothetical protein